MITFLPYATAQSLRCTRVVDGDTIMLSNRETVRPNTPVEYFGKEASAFTKNMVEDTTWQIISNEHDHSMPFKGDKGIGCISCEQKTGCETYKMIKECFNNSKGDDC